MITETCSCGASITVPVIYRAVLSEWRSGHRHDAEPTAAAESEDGKPPFIFESSGTLVESAPRADRGERDPIRVGFRPNGGDR